VADRIKAGARGVRLTAPPAPAFGSCGEEEGFNQRPLSVCEVGGVAGGLARLAGHASPPWHPGLLVPAICRIGSQDYAAKHPQIIAAPNAGHHSYTDTGLLRTRSAACSPPVTAAA